MDQQTIFGNADAGLAQIWTWVIDLSERRALPFLPRKTFLFL
jgi:hypothetical protein